MAPSVTEAIVALETLWEMDTPQRVPPLWPMVRWAIINRPLTQEWIVKAASAYPDLTTLEVTGVVPRAPLVAALGRWPALTDLSLRQYNDPTGMIRQCVAMQAPQLVRLSVAQLQDGGVLFREPLLRMPQLTALDLTATHITIPRLNAFAGELPLLRTLILNHAPIDALPQELLSSCPSLERLEVAVCAAKFKLADYVFLAAKCTTLTALNLTGFCMHSLSGRSISFLWESLPQLQEIDLSTASRGSAGADLDLPADRLVKLALRNASGTISNLAAIAARMSWPGTLRHLDLRAAEGARGAPLCALLRAAPKLDFLRLGAIGASIDDATVVVLGEHCPFLRTLDLSQSHVTDVGVAALALGCPNLTHLDLGSTRVSDATLEVLSRTCSALTHLDVSDCDERVTDVGVRHLASRCRALQSLNVSFTKRAITTSSLLAFAENELLLEVLDVNLCELVDVEALLEAGVALRVVGSAWRPRVMT